MPTAEELLAELEPKKNEADALLAELDKGESADSLLASLNAPAQEPLPSTVGMKAGGGWDFPEGTANPNASTFESMKRDRAVTAEEIKQKPWLARQVAGTAEAIKNMPMDMTQQVVELGQSAKAHPLDTLLNLEKQYGVLKPGGPVAAYTENFIGGPAKKLVSGEASEQGTVPFELMNLLGGVAPAFPALGKLSGMSKANKIIAEVESSTELAPYRNPAPERTEGLLTYQKPTTPSSVDALKTLEGQIAEIDNALAKPNANVQEVLPQKQVLMDMKNTLLGENEKWLFDQIKPELPVTKLGKDFLPEATSPSEILDSLPDNLRRELTLNIHYDLPTTNKVSGGLSTFTAQGRTVVGHGPVEDVGLARTRDMPREIISQDKSWGMEDARVLRKQMSTKQVEECFDVLNEGKNIPLNRLQNAFVAIYRRGMDKFFEEAKTFDPNLKKEKFYVHRVYEDDMTDIELTDRHAEGMSKPKLEASALKARKVRDPQDLKKDPMENYDRAHYELARQKYLRPALERAVMDLQARKSEMSPAQWAMAKDWVELMTGRAKTWDQFLRGQKFAGMNLKEISDNLATSVYTANLTANFFSALWNSTQSALFYGLRHPLRYAEGTGKTVADLTKHAMWKIDIPGGKKSHLINNPRIASTMVKSLPSEIDMSNAIGPITNGLLRAMPIGWVEPFLRGQVFYGEYAHMVKVAEKALKRKLTMDETLAVRKNAMEKTQTISPEDIHAELGLAGVPEKALFGSEQSVMEKAGLSAPKANRYAYLAASRKAVNTNFLPGSVEGNPTLFIRTPGITRIFSKYPLSAVDLMKNWIKGDVKELRAQVDSLVKTGKWQKKEGEQVLKEMLHGEDRWMAPIYIGVGTALSLLYYTGSKETKKTVQNVSYQAGPVGWLRAASAGPILQQAGKAVKGDWRAMANLAAGAVIKSPMVGPNADPVKILNGQQSWPEVIPFRGVRDLIYGSGAVKQKPKPKY